MTKRALFGSVRKRTSGRWQARYPAIDGRPMLAPHMFATKKDANAFLAKVLADRERGTYVDHRAGQRLLADYAAEWIENGGSRGKLSPRTIALYEDLLRLHIAPTIGQRALGAITPEIVRSWHTALLRSLAGSTTQRRLKSDGSARARQAYALLKSVMNTALSDDLIGRNPCRIVGAGTARSEERPLLSVEQFRVLVAAHPERMRAAAHLAMGAHLRIGELVGLQRRDLDLKAGTLVIERQIAKDGEGPTETKTKSRRVVDLPASVVDVMSAYLATVPKAMPTAPLFIRQDGRAFTRAAVGYHWRKARTAVGVEWAHLHDVRHAGLTLAAQAGATTRELMDRGGHSTSRAALLYQHASEARGPVLAAGLDAALTGL